MFSLIGSLSMLYATFFLQLLSLMHLFFTKKEQVVMG
jgi:hypothetical protein